MMYKYYSHAQAERYSLFQMRYNSTWSVIAPKNASLIDIQIHWYSYVLTRDSVAEIYLNQTHYISEFYCIIYAHYYFLI